MVPQFTFGAGTGKRPPPAAAIACGGAKAKQLLEVGLDALEVEEDHGAVGCSGSQTFTDWIHRPCKSIISSSLLYCLY